MTAPSGRVVGELMGLVAPAEAAFRCRWRMQTLERVDKDLHDRLLEQQALYDRALIAGPESEAREQTEAMVRGWRAAVAALESPLRPDDAYLVGFDQRTGIAVVIAERPQSKARAEVRDGQRIITVTPDEVAKIIAGWSVLTEAKSLFPDAEVVAFVGDGDEEGGDALRPQAMRAV